MLSMVSLFLSTRSVSSSTSSLKFGGNCFVLRGELNDRSAIEDSLEKMLLRCILGNPA